MLKFLLLACVLATVASEGDTQFDVIFQWKSIQFNWTSQNALEQAIKHKEYIVENNAIAGIKIWKDYMYLTIPRWREGVPATLARTPVKPVNNVKSPALDPYPNWNMQSLGWCGSFQFVQSMEIDPLGRMWVLDTGRTETMTLTPVARCPPRLVILDLENEGAVLRSYVFPETVAHKEFSYLNDIVLDHEDGGMAYISDNGRKDYGIIVYSLKDNKSWKIKHDSMKAQTDAVNFKVAGTIVTSPIHIDGIALSPPGPDRQLYYSPLSSFHLYSVPVSALKNDTATNISNAIKDVGRKISQAGGMIMSNTGVLYFGLLADDAIALWDTNKVNPSFVKEARKFVWDHALMQWPDTFAIDEAGQLWCVTNALQNFVTNHVNISRLNYRVIRFTVSTKNYQYFENGTFPELPVITSTADRVSLALSSCLTIVLVFLAH